MKSSQGEGSARMNLEKDVVEGVGGGLQENRGRGGHDVRDCRAQNRACAMQLTDSSSLRSTSAAVAGRPAGSYTLD
jgi:hypothetical protein